MPENPEVWLSERAHPTVRMKHDGVDITLERRGLHETGILRGTPLWVVTGLTLPSGGPLLRMGAEFECNNTSIIRAAEAAFETTPEGATYPRFTPPKAVRNA